MRKIFCILALIHGLLIPLVGLSEEVKRSNTQLNYMDYIEKGNNREKLSLDEFNILMKHLENAMKAFKDSLSKIKIEEANFNYETGKTFETQLTFAREQLDRAFEYLPEVKKYPNIVSNALQFYIDLMEVTQTAYDFGQISAFDKKLNDTHTRLSLWTMAFRKAHLRPLAYAKDKGKELYQEKGK